MNFEMLIYVFFCLAGVLIYWGCGTLTAQLLLKIITISYEGQKTDRAINIAKWGLVLTWPVILGVACVLVTLALMLVIFLIELILFLIISVLAFLVLGIPNLVIAIILIILSLVIIGGTAFFIAMSMWSSGIILVDILIFPFRWRSKKQKEQEEETN